MIIAIARMARSCERTQPLETDSYENITTIVHVRFIRQRGCIRDRVCDASV